MLWSKIGHIFDPTIIETNPFMVSHSQCPSTLIFDNFVRIYFSCRPKPIDGQYVSYTTYIDVDRKDLTKVINIASSPIMELGELGTFDEFAIYPTSILDEREINGQVKLFYAGWNRCSSVPYNVSIGLAKSIDDGVSFQRVNKGPILTRSAREPFELSGPKIRNFNGTLYMFYLAGEGWMQGKDKPESIYKIRLAINTNGEWKKLNKDIISSNLDLECQAGPDVFFLNGKYHLYFSYRHGLDFRNKERGYKIGYAYSNNLIDWTRDDSQTGIGLSATGWDSEMQHYPHVFELDGEHYMLYNGNDFGRYGLGLAKMIK